MKRVHCAVDSFHVRYINISMDYIIYDYIYGVTIELECGAGAYSYTITNSARKEAWLGDKREITSDAHN